MSTVTLSPRESELHAHLLTAASIEEIGRKMGLGKSDVYNRSTWVYSKCGVNSRLELLAREIERLQGTAR